MGMLETHPEVYERWRDAWLEDRTGELRIIVLTRCGGGNRPDYQSVFDEISKHPYYIEDYDDDYDNTYAFFAFKIPDKFKEWINGLVAYLKEDEPEKYPVIVDNRSLKERFEHATRRFTAKAN